jgi:hypothetical protein
MRAAFILCFHTLPLYNEQALAVCSRIATFYNSLTAFTENLPAARKTRGFATEYAAANDLLRKSAAPRASGPATIVGQENS